MLQPSSAQPMIASGGDRLVASVYARSYAAPREDVNKAELQTLLQQTDVLVLFLDNNHFSPMLWPTQRQATAFAPRKLLKMA